MGTPRVTLGVPVRNGADTIDRCLASILHQDFGDFEVIVSDNASTDETCKRVEAFRARDPRIRLIRQVQNVGMIENFNLTAREARGDLFRWVGADDWLEPDYLGACVSTLDAHPDAIVATSGFDLVDPERGTIYRQFEGEFLDSPDPRRRMARLFWFFHAGLGYYEPNYSLIRREHLFATGLLQIHRNNDWIFSTSLSLMGPFVHIPKLLFHRGWSHPDRATLARLGSRLHPVHQKSLESSLPNLYTGLARVVDRANLSSAERLACRLTLLRFCAAELRMRFRDGIRGLRRSVGINRDHVDRLSGGPRPR
jgi:glycosyltransferase involved in cell wall biosynthesis